MRWLPASYPKRLRFTVEYGFHNGRRRVSGPASVLSAARYRRAGRTNSDRFPRQQSVKVDCIHRHNERIRERPIAVRPEPPPGAVTVRRFSGCPEERAVPVTTRKGSFRLIKVTTYDFALNIITYSIPDHILRYTHSFSSILFRLAPDPPGLHRLMPSGAEPTGVVRILIYWHIDVYNRHPPVHSSYARPGSPRNDKRIPVFGRIPRIKITGQTVPLHTKKEEPRTGSLSE